jgi:hypothetical protein
MVVEKERAEYAVEARVPLLVLEFVKVVVHGFGYLELLRHVYPLSLHAQKSTDGRL